MTQFARILMRKLGSLFDARFNAACSKFDTHNPIKFVPFSGKVAFRVSR